MMLLPSTKSARAPARRILLYSHDSFGLGHLRRTSTIAAALATAFPGSSVLIATGSPCATHFPLGPGVDVIKLPSVTKDTGGRYVPRSLFPSLAPLLRIRERLLHEVLESFAPDLLIVDHQVLGLGDELAGVLARARDAGTKTLLGVRDIIDSPEAVAREWGRAEIRRALVESYDRICVYGTPEVFDPRVEYPLPPELRERLEFVGYIAGRAAPVEARPSPAGRPEVLVTVGGGEDGAERIESYLDALALAPAAWTSTILLGPLADPERIGALRKRARRLDGVRLQLFHADLPHLLARANAVVSMAGYNTVVEILQAGTPAILLPRSFPRREQLLRAERLAALGLVTCIAAPTPHNLRRAVDGSLRASRGTNETLRPRKGMPSFDGCSRLARVASDLLDSSERRAVGNVAP